MMILRMEALEAQGIAYRTATQFTFDNQVFSKGQSFPIRMRQVAIELAQGYQASGTLCLLVESADHVTICLFKRQLAPVAPTAPPVQVQSKPLVSPSPRLPQVVSPVVAIADPQPQAEPFSAPSAGMTYRGAKLPSPESQPVAPTSEATMTYRGAKIQAQPTAQPSQSTEPSQDEPEPPSAKFQMTYRGVKRK
ncbi:MAG: DUF4278 domain-containing protein [Oculatellaceae cyanobacterium Prado106]|jgi:hypothetical protein|nr:DUF4278 domain-containing protein [Oculatellaceae cyanobacterium Prado106]